MSEAAQEIEQEIEAIKPSSAHRTQKLRLGDLEKEYTQKPLSFFGKLRLFAVLGNTIETAMSGENPVSVSGVLNGVGGRGSVLSASDLSDADSFVRSVAKIASFAPSFLGDLYCVALGVPPEEELWAKMAMDQQKEEGGLSDDDGVEIMETFFDQNAKVMRDFYVERLKPMVDRLMAQVEQPQSVKPSKATRVPTRKR